MNRRNFIKKATALAVLTPAVLVLAKNTETEKVRPTGVIHYMNGPHFQWIEEENGEMFCHDMCDCGCIDEKWKINEGDTIVAWRPALFGHLKKLKIIAREFKIFRTTTLERCNLCSRDCE